MFILDLTLSTPQANLALDEALLDMCEAGFKGEILRFWEPRSWFVVLGYSNHWKQEVYFSKCRREAIPIFRRSSGGGTVLQGPGCFNYALILNIKKRKSLKNPVSTNLFILKKIKRALEPLVPEKISLNGVTDLSIHGKKFSGNAQRRKLQYALFHGTFLTHFNAKRVQKFLAFPSKSPPYRKGRSHLDFLTDLNVPPEVIKRSMAKTWNARRPLQNIPWNSINELLKKKYNLKSWNLKF